MSLIISENNTNDRDVIYEIYFNYQCNYRCSYCYSHSGPEKMTFENVNILLDKFNAIPDEDKQYITIQFLGGEPLIFEHFEYFLTHISKKFKLTLTTNFSLLPNFVDLVNSHKNLEIEFSLHYEYFSKEYFDNLYYLMTVLTGKKLIIFNINPAVEFNKYNMDLVEVSNKLKSMNINNYEIVTNAIDSLDISKYFPLYDVKENNTENYTIYDTKTDKTVHMNYNDIFVFLRDKYNFNFKMSLCHFNFFRIDYNLDILDLCDNEKTLRNIKTENFFVEPIKRICLLENCTSSCLFNCKKKIKGTL